MARLQPRERRTASIRCRSLSSHPSLSTPINQLPSSASAAAIAGTYPTYSAASGPTAVDAAATDTDAAVNELLKQLNAEAASIGAAPSHYSSQPHPQPAQLAMPAQMKRHFCAATAGAIPADLTLLSQVWRTFAPDLKLALVAFALVALVIKVHVSTMLSGYLAVERIPYHDIVLSASVVAVGVFIAKRFVG